MLRNPATTPQKILAFLLSAMLGCLMYISTYDLHRGIAITASNDEWEHQTLAVNYAYGHGLFRLGFYEDPGKYDLGTYENAFPTLRTIAQDFPMPFYYRNAGTNWFNGNFYRLFGVDAGKLRLFQFGLAVLAWGLLSLILYKQITYYWQLAIYFWAGLAFYYFSFPIIDLVGDESMQLFTNTLLFFVLLRWRKNLTVLNTLAIVLVLIYSLFLKSTLLLLPPMLLAVELITGNFKHFAALVLVSLITFLFVEKYSDVVNDLHRHANYPDPQKFNSAILHSHWSAKDSAFISKYHLKPSREPQAVLPEFYHIYNQVMAIIYLHNIQDTVRFLMSQQSLLNFIHGNNIYCLEEPVKHVGSYKPAWLIDSANFFYGAQPGLPSVLRIIAFYKIHYPLLPQLIRNKMKGALWDLWYYIPLLLLLTFYFFQLFLPHTLSLVLSLSLLAIGIYALPLAGVLVLLFGLLLLLFRKKIPAEIHLSIFFVTYILIFSLLLHGIYRFTMIVNFAVFFFIAQVLISLPDLWKNQKKKSSAF